MTTTTVDLPAICGGTPVKATPYNAVPRYGDEELQQLREALAQGSLFYAHGGKVAALTAEFAARHRSAHVIACSSGTAAIHAALIAAGISPDDEVIVPPITDMGSVLPVLWQGAVPIFADLDSRTGTLDPAAVERAITPRTRAILAVHLAGNPCDLAALTAIADRHGLLLVEDCAQAWGTTYDGRPVGTFGRIGCYSFNEFKHIACGDGGVVLTDDAAIASTLRLAVDKGYDRLPGVVQRNPTFLANNYRMTELQGAVALAQLWKIDAIVSRRQDWCGRLTRRLTGVPGVRLPEVADRGTHSYWFYLMRVDAAELGGDADQFASALAAEGLPATAHYIGRPVYTYPLFTGHSAFARGSHPFARVDYTQTRCPVAEAILDSCVKLTVNESYNEQDLEDTIRAITRVVAWFRLRR